mgnify:CR=1 FL=1
MMYINPIIVPSQKKFNINIIIEMKSKGPKYIAAPAQRQPSLALLGTFAPMFSKSADISILSMPELFIFSSTESGTVSEFVIGLILVSVKLFSSELCILYSLSVKCSLLSSSVHIIALSCRFSGGSYVEHHSHYHT